MTEPRGNGPIGPEDELAALAGLDLEIGRPRGTYFVMTRCAGDDTGYVKDLIASRGVAAIPGSAFYYNGRAGPGRGLVRFAFCKPVSYTHLTLPTICSV